MSSVSEVYSKALEEVASVEECLEVFDLKEILTKEYKSFFNSPLVSFSQKIQIIEKLPLSKTIKSFLYQLTLKNRWPYFDQICEKIKERIENKQKLIKGVLYTVEDIEKEEVENIEEKLKKFFKGVQVELQVKKKPSLVSGFCVYAGGIKFDDSLFSHLKQFKSWVGAI